METLVAFWRTALRRGIGIEDLKRWFYVIGCSLEDSDTGRARLTELHDHFEAHLQDQRLPAPKLPWDHFIEAAAALFRNPTKQNHIRSFKASSKTPSPVREHYNIIPANFKAAPASVSPNLIQHLLNAPAEMVAA